MVQESSAAADEPHGPKLATTRPFVVLLALAAALIAGAVAGGLTDNAKAPLLAMSGIVGGLWLNALKMTVIPLVVALLVTAIAKGAEAARAGRIAGRAVVWIVALCTASAIFGMVMIQLLTAIFPLPQATGAALEAGLAAVSEKPSDAPLPGIADFFRNIVPDNAVAAAANGDVLPLVVFALLFAMAATRIAPEKRRSLVALMEAVADALLVIIGWVLWLAPLGVFALGFTVGASAGAAVFAGLGHYILLVSIVGLLVALAAYPLAIIVGRVRAGIFARSMLAPQSVAISTRSSLASLPAMLAAARSIGIGERAADITLPLAVALFRATGPAMNVAVAFYVAHWLGLEPTLGQVIAATAVGAVMSYGAISLPGEVSFISSIAPIAMALGVPVAPLALLVAVEMVPDIFRTLGNVSMDVALVAVAEKADEPA